MSRFLPRGLFGQTLLVLLAGLIVSHAIGFWIYTACPLGIRASVRVFLARVIAT